MARLDDARRAAFLAEHPDWDLSDETITRTYVLTDFNEAMGFVGRVALAAEAADHHPDIDIRWNKVTLALSTHEEGALTRKDVELATLFDGYAG